ncbi:CehA/McbA family metallohydrolase [Amycolatopsis acidiphila]|uniref:Phosphoesterase n=1 Tax=Amycolatopsis acidiphila TaxID=715473 RepID=A0A557ZXR7_9PSEU|nr:CehA/McbA family metallohydrolase [Amycolatopsis acidiphila]TVT16813.1 phosphoesterase [Amycolatopsis acidiphila]UIJ57073.1 CehA/McbA family metallohydrolase [Amycolatopsis acidiphila]GHG53514.1 phosphoesterase [Amycolatopsis acidiphila]
MSSPDLTRRNLLRAGGVLAAGAAVNLLPGVAFADPGPGTSQQTKTVTGTFAPDIPDWYYLPVEVPRGVSQIDVVYSYDKPAVPAGIRGNACDIGMFGPEGIQLGNERGFRGWSGGFRDRFSISASQATPGYLAGPVTPGTWHVILGPYTVAPQGLAYRVDITLTFGPQGKPFRPNPAPLTAPARQRGRAWYRGDCHLHTVHSDGRRTPEQLVADSRAAGLDFIVSTDHNTSSAQLQWGDHATSDLLILNGEEVTTRSGHWPAIGLPAGTWIDWRYRAGDPKDFRRFVDQVHKAGGLVTAAHPFANCFGCTYEFGYEIADLVEVWNGPWTDDDQQTVNHWDGLLRSGQWIPAIGDSDAHNPDQVVALPHTVVLADSLRRQDLLAGLKAGRSWLAESAQVSLSCTASGGGRSAGIGDRLHADTGTPVTVEATVGGVPGSTVSILDQLGVEHTETVGASGTATVRWTTYPRYSRWVRVEVRRPAGGPGTTVQNAMVAMTNPIFLGES